ncbi:MAG: DUF362 domain-containing protein [Candidatus Hodarchaeota archaeon]
MVFSIYKILIPNKLKKSLIFFNLVNLSWLIFRTGTKPSRITYPCQQAALSNLSFSLSAFIPLSITTSFFTAIKSIFSKKILIILIILISGGITSVGYLKNTSPEPYQEIQLTYESKNATISPSSDIFVMNGRSAAHIDELINLMSTHNLLFYQSNDVGENKGPEGLIAIDDIVLLKFNSQWAERGGTNTDILRELIQAIIDHPDGFIGEIVVADNGQGRGSMNYPSSNAENYSQSTQDVINMFSSIYQVSSYNWQNIRNKLVNEYSEGDMNDGYIVYDTADPETGIYVSYPKFKTGLDTYISFKHGLWNGTGYEKRVKVINLPVLKSHLIYGVTASLKNYMGVQSEGLANGHSTVATGGMGTLMAECGLPTLNIVDAIWVNANPYPSGSTGPATSYYEATRVNILIAGIDPIALDYWAAKHVLLSTASSIGYHDLASFNPDNTERNGLREAFGVWLNLTKNELISENYNVTTNETRMNIYVYQNHAPISSYSKSSTTPAAGFWIICITLSLAGVFLVLRKRRKMY